MKLTVNESKNWVNKFAGKPTVECNHYSTWFSDVYISHTNNSLELTDDENKEYTLYRSYKIWNQPLAWDLQLYVENICDDPVENIPLLTFPIYDWIENYLNEWDYSSIEDLKCELRKLAWDILLDWKNIMTPSLEKVLELTLENEIEHQLERFKTDIEESIAKFNAEMVTEEN